ncbi:MAG: hypothetical protein H0W79_05615 [Rubrobacteraceae bacterium]|nr:hypothetical protein [Rubrobacteraceae bacterium]
MNVASLYLYLRSKGLELSLVDRPERPDGFVFRIEGLKDLEPATAGAARWLIAENRAALIALLKSDSPDAAAVRQEARRTATEREQRKERHE